MSFIFDSTKNKKNDKNKTTDSNTIISVVDILTHRANHLDSVTDNLDKNIDNIIDHVNNFIDNTENNHKELLDRVVKDEVTHDMNYHKMEETMDKLRDRINSLKEANDSLESNLEDFNEQIKNLKHRLKVSFCILVVLFFIVFGTLFALTLLQ